MGPDIELKGKSKAAPEVQVGKEILPVPPISEQKDIQAGNNDKCHACGTEALPNEQTALSNGNEDAEVNITGCSNSGKHLVVEVSCDDVTEYSSSFGDTRSDAENENGSTLSDDEVESQINTGNASSPVHAEGFEPFRIRKKKLTDHWRRFIHPLMWRCKWIELQERQLQSQALKYAKELAAYEHRKQQEFANFKLDGLDTKSVPFSGSIGRNKVMMRKKRRKVEGNCDLASYMSNHSIFSYYENKNPADVANLKAAPVVAFGNAGNTEEFRLEDILSSLDCKDSDEILKDLILKIEAVHARIRGLKTRVDTVISENPVKFSSVNKLSICGPSEGLNNFDKNPTSPTSARNKNTSPVTSVKTEFNMGDLLLHGSEVTSCVEMCPLIETTDKPQHEVLWEDTKDGVLIHNRVAKEELHTFENAGNQLVKTTDESVEEQKSISSVQGSEPSMAAENVPPILQSAVRVCSTSKSSFPRNRRRGKRKSS
ncbi:uncharacterized protein G2W53_016247 [Senna tora]|uniref:Uncharacterized protein n=1 Tax=Senna tora TaxID=362788 RepID=A0A834TMK9_9FABA|nr:uncharacterized protein G2W53_016247 [Senna tora]